MTIRKSKNVLLLAGKPMLGHPLLYLIIFLYHHDRALPRGGRMF